MRNKRRMRRNPIVRSLRRLVRFFRKLFGLKQKRRPIYVEERVNVDLQIEPVKVVEPAIPEADFWDNYEWAKLGDLLTQVNWQAESLEIAPHADSSQSNPQRKIDRTENFELMTLGDLLATIAWQPPKTAVYTKAIIPERQTAGDPLLN